MQRPAVRGGDDRRNLVPRNRPHRVDGGADADSFAVPDAIPATGPPGGVAVSEAELLRAGAPGRTRLFSVGVHRLHAPAQPLGSGRIFEFLRPGTATGSG